METARCLDHSAILYGSALSDGNAHSNTDLPLVIAGRTGWASRRPARCVGAGNAVA